MDGNNKKFYRALLSRDNKFDGKFFSAVKTTKIYCRPICPARPKLENVVFFNTAQEAERAGYRPCKRCRPESSPTSPAWFGKSAVVQRALKIMLNLNFEPESEENFALRFGISGRQLRRLFLSEIGRTPKQFYQDLRLGMARKLLTETSIPVTDVAFSSGFQSLRRFNEAFRQKFKCSPSDQRKRSSFKAINKHAASIRLDFRPPLNWPQILRYLKRHEVFNLEEISEGDYIRFFHTADGVGSVHLYLGKKENELVARFDGIDPRLIGKQIQQLRSLFDLDADPMLISTTFEACPYLSRIEKKVYGIRSLGSWDPFETAIGIILGQLVSLKQGRNLMRQIVENYGEKKIHNGKLHFAFPTPEKLRVADLAEISTSQNRKKTIQVFSDRVAKGEIELNSYHDIQKTKRKLREIPGIGPWTVECIAMRCLNDADSFPKTDLILKRALEENASLSLENVSPWRSYAAHLIWENYLESK